MKPSMLRVMGVIFLLAAAVVSWLNVRPGLDWGAVALPTSLFIIGLAAVLRARKRRL